MTLVWRQGKQYGRPSQWFWEADDYRVSLSYIGDTARYAAWTPDSKPRGRSPLGVFDTLEDAQHRCDAHAAAILT